MDLTTLLQSTREQKRDRAEVADKQCADDLLVRQKHMKGEFEDRVAQCQHEKNMLLLQTQPPTRKLLLPITPSFWCSQIGLSQQEEVEHTFTPHMTCACWIHSDNNTLMQGNQVLPDVGHQDLEPTDAYFEPSSLFVVSSAVSHISISSTASGSSDAVSSHSMYC
jgi:hypothetical protein